ncbi:MAG: aminotransferase class I/II-fold pyridoxal phosphate-dependent enzyme [Defluviitaleaceae bacterium]|nr:aminotransferase class I/II-fold pyridoxal phosphate-dependent enzyme [Defluviitaleaceae bacterium]
MNSKFLSDKARHLTPYIAGIQPRENGWIKLNTNENPYPPSPKVFEALATADATKLRLYPDGESSDLQRAVARAVSDELRRAALPQIAGNSLPRKHMPASEHPDAGQPIKPENIFCANSSDEVLALAYQAFFAGKTRILSPDISYGFYPVWGEMYDAGTEFIPVGQSRKPRIAPADENAGFRADFSINPADYAGGNGVILANPNAPTGLALSRADIEKILRQNPDGVVIIDEAYIAFAAPETSAVALVNEYENLLVTRTFSKSHSLAGLRVGYAIGQPHLIDGLRRVRDAFNSYPLDMIAQNCAAAAISDTEYYAETTAKIIAAREFTTDFLHSLKTSGEELSVLPSQANFIFAKFPDAPALYDFLRRNKILVRHWSRLKNFLRISIGTQDEMEEFCQCVKRFLNDEQKKRT